MRSTDQRRGWTLITGMFLLFMLVGLFSARNDRKYAGRTTSVYNWLSFTRSTATITEHPITKLMDGAKVTFTNLLAKQSKTLPKVVTEYKHRYAQDPLRDVKLMDEFDAIAEDLASFGL